jgi:aspartate/methionine/tyrosine aminotransferase
VFARRLPAEIHPSALALEIAACRAAGGELLDLTQSNPTRAGFDYPPDLLEAFRDPRALVYDPDSLGLEEVRRQISPHRVVLTSSTSEAYSWLFKLLCDPGDEVLIPRPSYPLFELLAGLECVQTRTYPLRYHEGWFIDFDALRAAITERTKAILVVNPNNPTGNYLKASEYEQLARLNLPVISDEVFADYSFGPKPYSLAGSSEGLTFVLNGLSKSAGLPQMKLGWIILSGPERLVHDAAQRLELIADTYLSVGTPVQVAFSLLVATGKAIQSQIQSRLRSNLDYLRRAVTGSSASLLDVEAGWSAILRVPNVRSEEEWVRLLLSDCGTLVQPGYFFDFESNGWLVISLLTPEHIFREGVARVLQFRFFHSP